MMARAPQDPNLTWLLDVVWGGIDGLQITDSPPEHASASFVVVPSRRRARALVPDAGRAGRAALLAGGATRGRRSKRERALTAWVVGTRPVSGVFRDRVWIVGDDPLRASIESALGGQRVMLAATVRPPGPFRKPVVQAVTPEGRVVAYAKVAWNAVTGANVVAEHTALTGVAALETDAVKAPRPIALVEHKGFPVVLTHPMPASLRRYDASAPPPPPDVSRAVARALGARATEGDPIGERLRARLDAVRTTATLPEVAEETAALLAAIGTATRELPAGAWHGDWSPWNLGRDGGQLWAWDWEYCRADAPVGLDIPHFLFQQRFIGQRAPLEEAFASARTSAAAPLSALGYDEPARSTIYAVHAAEIAVRYVEADAMGVAANPRFVTNALPALRSAMDQLG